MTGEERMESVSQNGDLAAGSLSNKRGDPCLSLQGSTRGGGGEAGDEWAADPSSPDPHETRTPACSFLRVAPQTTAAPGALPVIFRVLPLREFHYFTQVWELTASGPVRGQRRCAVEPGLHKQTLPSTGLFFILVLRLSPKSFDICNSSAKSKMMQSGYSAIA